MIVESFSGIRGIYGEDITEEIAQKYAISYCREFKPSVLVIGGDSRSSTASLKKAIIQALDVEKIIDVGVLPVQTVEHAVFSFSADGGFYISASHNEPEYNGWKMLKKDGSILYEEQANKIIERVHNFKEEIIFKDKEIIDKSQEAKDNYISYLLQKLGDEAVKKIREKNFKVLADPNGGSSINILPILFEKLNVKAHIINKNLGEFKRKVEPNKESLSYLKDKVKDYDFAFGFDADADRVEFVLKSDHRMSGQYVLALACDALLKGTKNQVVVVNDATSCLVRDVIKKHHAVIKETEVGEINVVVEMEKQKSIVGGEGSNGGVVVSPIKCRDGIMTTCLIFKIMAQENKSLVDIVSEYPKYYSKRDNLRCSNPLSVKNSIEEYFKDYKIKKTGDETGGMKIMFDDNSFLFFRQSKTEAEVFRIIADGDDEHKVTEMLQKGIELFKKYA